MVFTVRPHVLGQLAQRVFKEIVVGVRIAQSRDRGLKGLHTKKVALVGPNVAHAVECLYEGGTCDLAVLIDNERDRHRMLSMQRDAIVQENPRAIAEQCEFEAVVHDQ